MKPVCAKSQHGQALIEFAMVIPVVVLLLLGGADLIMAFSAKQNVTYVAEETARCWALRNTNCWPSGYQPYARSVASGLGLLNSGTLAASSNGCGPNCASITVSYRAAPMFQGFFPSVALTSTAQYTTGP
jgi:Flp pilus assembly protein TadG